MASRKHSLFLRTFSTLVMLACAAALGLSMFSMFISPAKFWILTLFGLSFLILFLLNILMLIWGLVLRSRSVIIPLLVLIPALCLTGRYVRLGKVRNTEIPESECIKVLTWNVGSFSLWKKDAGVEGWKSCSDSVMAFLHKSDADIICLQEFFFSKKHKVEDIITREFPGWDHAFYTFTNSMGTYGIVTLSRLPILSTKKFDFMNSFNRALSTDIQTPAGCVRVYNCHFESYGISPKNLVHSLDSTMVRETETKFRQSIQARAKQADMIASSFKDSPYDVIITGDFNDCPVSYTYNSMASGRKDAFIEAGHGSGRTYSYIGPFLRLDYILYPEKWKAASYSSPRLHLSDHNPVITSLKPVI